MLTVRGVTVTAYALSALAVATAALCLFVAMEPANPGRHRGCAPASPVYTRAMETTAAQRFTIEIVNPESGCTVIGDATLADRPVWRGRMAVFLGPDALMRATAELERIETAWALDSHMVIDRCVSKIGEPYAMRECGRALVYRDGWRHLDDSVNESHWGFPQRGI